MSYHALNFMIVLNLQNSKQNSRHMQNKAIFEISIFDSCRLGTAPKPCYLLPDCSLHSGTPNLTSETTQFALSVKLRANLDLWTRLLVPENPVRKSDLFIQIQQKSFRLMRYYALNATVMLNLENSKQNGRHTQNKAIFWDFYFWLVPSGHSSETLLFTTRLFLSF